MPLFEISEDELVPFRRLKGGADLFEKEIEDLLWANLEIKVVWGVLYRAANTVMWRLAHELEEPAHLNLRGFSATGADVAYLRQHAIGLLEASS